MKTKNLSFWIQVKFKSLQANILLQRSVIVGENLPVMQKSAFGNNTIEKIQKVAALGSAET